MAKYTTYRVNRLLEGIRAGYTIRASCARAGIARITYYEWLEKHPKFKAKVEQAQEDALFALEQELLAHRHSLLPQGLTALIYTLKNRYPDEWNEKQKMEHSMEKGQYEELMKQLADLRQGGEVINVPGAPMRVLPGGKR